VSSISGERVSSPRGGFNPAWQRHAACYLLTEPSLGDGPVLDVGCGVGHSFHLLAPRRTVGVDVAADALAGQDRETVVADMRALPFEDASFASVVAIHSVEHVPDPEKAVREAARVLTEDGVAVYATPNRLTFGRPDEIIDPYHYVEFDPGQLGSLCRAHFADVELRGLFASGLYMEIFREEREKLDRLLRRDPLRMRRLVPVRARRRLYDWLLRRNRRLDDPRYEAIEITDFELRAAELDDALDLFAFCRSPLAPGSEAEHDKAL
jgi:SAM-dependent methyltransferase